MTRDRKPTLECTTVQQLNLRNTRLHGKVVGFFLAHPGIAYTEREIHESVGLQFDKVSVYRTLRRLILRQFIHKAIGINGTLRFALNDQNPSSPFYIHFECMQCGTVFYLPQCNSDVPEVPNGFNASSYHYLVEGTCNQCQQ
jgi:Fur family transcriptional regulator, ferric uptake regulator